MYGKKYRFVMLLVLIFSFSNVWAKAEVVIKLIPEKEKIVKEANGEVKKRVPAKTIEPGEVIIYTIRYSNRGDEPATDADVKNPVPENTVYLSGSARGKGSDITFSADGGKTFGKASSVTYQVRDSDGKSVTRKANPENYTHIRWLIKIIEAGKSGELEYRVRVK